MLTSVVLPKVAGVRPGANEQTLVESDIALEEEVELVDGAMLEDEVSEKCCAPLSGVGS